MEQEKEEFQGEESPEKLSPSSIEAGDAGVNDSPRYVQPRSSEGNQTSVTLMLEAMAMKLEQMKLEQDQKLREQQEITEKQNQMIREQREISEKQSQMIREQKEMTEKQIQELRIKRSTKGVTTKIQFVHELRRTGFLKDMQQGHAWYKMDTKWPSDLQHPKVPKDGATELASNDKGCVQLIVTDVLKKLLKYATANVWPNYPDPKAYKKTSFRTRKPDIVNYKKGFTGPIAITAFGDCKKRGEGDFGEDEIGHILDMARSYMEDIGAMIRPFLIVFLTDGKRWQFFRVRRKADGLDYYQDPIINDSNDGWKQYVALLQEKEEELGFVQPFVTNTNLHSILGAGMSAIVYEGTYGKKKFKGQVVLAKIYQQDQKSAFDAERVVLERLKEGNVKGVPIILGVERVTVSGGSVQEFHDEALIVIPVGQRIASCSNPAGKYLTGKHLKQLVDIVQFAHAKGFIHRDINPANVYLVDDDNESWLLLNDWGSSTDTDKGKPWQGTIGYSVHFEEPIFVQTNARQRDLVSVVRTAFSLLYHEMAPHSNVLEVTRFWKERLASSGVWTQGLEYAMKLEYEKLSEWMLQRK